MIGRPLFVSWSIVIPEQDEMKTTVAEDAHSWLDETTHFIQNTRWRRTLHSLK